MSTTETKPKRTRKSKDVSKIIETVTALSYQGKKEVAAALATAINEQAAEMKAQAEATLKMIGV